MGTPACATIESYHSIVSSSKRLFETLDDLDSERDQTDSVHIEVASDKNTSELYWCPFPFCS